MKNKGSKRDHVLDPKGIEVSSATKEKLLKIQEDESKSNMDLVIRELLHMCGHEDEDNAANSDEEDDEDVQDEDDGETPLRQMKFSKDLLRNEKALKYYTGLKRPTYQWTLQALKDAVRFFFFSSSVSLGLPGFLLCLFCCTFLFIHYPPR